MVNSILMKSRDGVPRGTYSVKINLELVKWLKHEAIDRGLTVGQLVEEAIKLLQENKPKGSKKK